MLATTRVTCGSVSSARARRDQPRPANRIVSPSQCAALIVSCGARPMSLTATWTSRQPSRRAACSHVGVARFGGAGSAADAATTPAAGRGRSVSAGSAIASGVSSAGAGSVGSAGSDAAAMPSSPSATDFPAAAAPTANIRLTPCSRPARCVASPVIRRTNARRSMAGSSAGPAPWPGPSAAPGPDPSAVVPCCSASWRGSSPIRPVRPRPAGRIPCPEGRPGTREVAPTRRR